MAEVESINLVITAIEQATAQIQSVSTSLNSLGATATRTSARVGGLNKTLHSSLSVMRGMFIRIIALTAAAAALGLATRGTIGAALDFEDSFIRIQKTVDLTTEGFERLSKANRELAKILPVNVNEINRIGEIAGQLGVEGVSNILKFEETIARLAVSTNLTADSAATDMARLAAVMQLPVSQIDRMGASLVDLGNNFETTEAEILRFATRISGAGAVIGLTTADVLALGAGFTASGVNIERGGTAVQKTLLRMQKAVVTSNEQLTVFSTLLQITDEQFATLFRENPIEALLQFISGLTAVGEDAVRVLDALDLTDQRLIGTFLQVAAAEGKVRAAVLLSSVAWEENTALVAESERQFSSTRNQIILAKNNFNDLGIALGTTMLPALVAVSKAAIVVADHINVATLAFLALFGVLATGLVILGILSGPVGWAALVLGIGAVVGAIAFLGLKWDDVMGDMPLATQEMVVKVLESIDQMINAIFTAINSLIDELNSIASGKGGGRLGKFLGGVARAAGVPDLIDLLGGDPAQLISPITAVSNIAEQARQTFLNNRFRRLVEIGAKPDDTEVADLFNIPELDLDDFLSGLESVDDLGTASAATAAKVDILADGIITWAEALEFGITVVQAATLELGHEAFEAASRMFRVRVELEKLGRRTPAGNRAEADLRSLELEVEFQKALRETNIQIAQLTDLLADQGLTSKAATFIGALVGLGEGFRQAEESIMQFLNRLVTASVNAAQTQFSKLFQRPSREEAQLNLVLANARRRRALLVQSGAPEGLLQAIDEEIRQITLNLDVRRAEEDILKARLVLADQTLLSQRDQFAQAQLLIGIMAAQTELQGQLNWIMGLETLARLDAVGGLIDFTAALRAGRNAIALPAESGGAVASMFSVVVNAETASEIRTQVMRELDRQLNTAGLGGASVDSGTFV